MKNNLVLKNLILEITRYEKEREKRGLDPNPEFSLFKSFAVPPDAIPTHAFTMVALPKVGLNPKSGYKTPLGVYFYPLNERTLNQLEISKLPFAGDKPYVGLVKLNYPHSSKWLRVSDNQFGKNRLDEAFQTCYDFFLEKKNSTYINKSSYTLADFKDECENTCDEWDYSSYEGKIFKLTWFTTKSLNKSSLQWNILLRKLGFIGLIDTGTGTIHPAEEEQVVSLTPEGYEIIRVFDREQIQKHVRKNSYLSFSCAEKAADKFFDVITLIKKPLHDVYAGLFEFKKYIKLISKCENPSGSGMFTESGIIRFLNAFSNQKILNSYDLGDMKTEQFSSEINDFNNLFFDYLSSANLSFLDNDMTQACVCLTSLTISSSGSTKTRGMQITTNWLRSKDDKNYQKMVDYIKNMKYDSNIFDLYDDIHNKKVDIEMSSITAYFCQRFPHEELEFLASYIKDNE